MDMNVHHAQIDEKSLAYETIILRNESVGWKYFMSNFVRLFRLTLFALNLTLWSS